MHRDVANPIHINLYKSLRVVSINTVKIQKLKKCKKFNSLLA